MPSTPAVKQRREDQRKTGKLAADQFLETAKYAINYNLKSNQARLAFCQHLRRRLAALAAQYLTEEEVQRRELQSKQEVT